MKEKSGVMLKFFAWQNRVAINWEDDCGRGRLMGRSKGWLYKDMKSLRCH